MVAQGQVQLVGEGRDLLMGNGTLFDLQDDVNPFIRSTRVDQQGPRPYAHGSYTGSEWQNEVVIPIRVIINGANRDVASTRAAIQQMSAAFASVGATGEISEFRFYLDEDDTEYVMFGRGRGFEPDLSTIANGWVYATAAVVCADPRVYSGDLSTLATGLPLQQGGLTIPAQPATTRLRLPGTSGAYASTADHASLDITGDLDLRADLHPSSWTPSAISTFIAKYDTTGNQRSYYMRVATNGTLSLLWSTDGTAFNSVSSTVPVTATGRLSVRATLDVNNGASGNTVVFYTAPSMSGTWTQLGAPVVTAGVTSIFASTTPLVVSGTNLGTSNLFEGTVYSIEVRNGIGGTIAANPNFETQNPGAGTFTDSTGKLWSMTGGAQIVGGSSYRRGVNAPFTIPGVLNGGYLDLVNTGTSPTGLTVRIDGPATEPRLFLRRPDGSVQSIRFLIDLISGQWIDIDTTRRLALLNGSPEANLRGAATWDMDAYPLLPGTNVLRFLSAEYDASSQLTASHRSAWW